MGLSYSAYSTILLWICLTKNKLVISDADGVQQKDYRVFLQLEGGIRVVVLVRPLSLRLRSFWIRVLIILLLLLWILSAQIYGNSFYF